MRYILEVIADSVTSAMSAERGGADRLELVANLSEGGTTPSYGLICKVRKQTSINLHVMIRPRSGDFCYSDDEFEVMETDILECKKLGINGYVFGILNANKSVDVSRTRRLVDLAKPLKVTFHRAFDVTPNPYIALSDIVATGADCLLTSGQENEALMGAPLIAELISKGEGKITIMPGSGVYSGNINELVQKTGARQYHTSAKVRTSIAESKEKGKGVLGFGNPSDIPGDFQEVRAIKSLLQDYKKY